MILSYSYTYQALDQELRARERDRTKRTHSSRYDDSSQAVMDAAQTDREALLQD